MSILESTLEKIGRIMSEQYGIRVVCQGERCCTNGKTIYLPSLPDDLPDDLARTIHALCDHECGHIIAKSDFKVGAAFRAKHGAAAFGVLNCLEDLRIERVMAETFPGSAANLAYGYRYAHETAKQAVARGETLPIMKQVAIAIATKGTGKPEWPEVSTEIYAAVTPLVPLLRQAEKAGSTAKIVPLAEKVWEKMRPFFKAEAGSSSSASSPEEEAGGDNAGGSGGTGGVDSDQTGSDPTRSDAKARRDQTTRKNNSGTPDKSSQQPPGAATLSHTGPDQTRSQAKAGGAGAQGDFVDSTGLLGGLGEALGRRIAQHTANSKGYRVWTTERDRVLLAPEHATIPHHERMQAVLPHVAGVRQKLLQTLMADVRARWLPDVERGDLNPRALHRLATARQARDNGAPALAESLSRRVFRQRVVAKRRDTAVSLLIDLSQSMRGLKIDLARKTALVFCEALGKLGIPTAVVGFSTDHANIAAQAARETQRPTRDLQEEYRLEPLLHVRFKDFNERFERVSGRFEAMEVHRLTPLGESMLFAARELARRPEERKVLMVLTDGRPAVGLGNEDATFLHAQRTIQRIERAGIDTALIGIQDGSVLSLHPRSVVVHHLADLPGTVMGQLQRLLTEREERVLPHAPTSA